jgi:hypothetical protein
MLPHEKELVEKWKDRPFALVGINSDKGGSETLRKIVAEQGIKWRNAVEGSTSGPIASSWNVRGWPTLVVIDAEGVIRWKGHGGDWEKVAEEWLRKAEAAQRL